MYLIIEEKKIYNFVTWCNYKFITFILYFNFTCIYCIDIDIYYRYIYDVFIYIYILLKLAKLKATTKFSKLT